MRKIEIGSGNHPEPGFEHLDINPNLPCLEYVSEMDKIPVEDNTFDELRAIHVIEHQFWRQVRDTLKEWVRVVKPGGKLYIATPNLRWIAKSYLEARGGNREEVDRDLSVFNEDQSSWVKFNGQDVPDAGLWANFKIMSSGGTYDQHYTAFDATILTKLLQEAGASRVEVEYDKEYLSVIGYK
jgi:SAM-dependent methyltransferase